MGDALPLFALTLPAAASIGVPAYRTHRTGAELARAMPAEPGQGSNSIRRERAMGYIEGVADATTGQQGDASPMVLAALAKLYPCRAGGIR